MTSKLGSNSTPPTRTSHLPPTSPVPSESRPLHPPARNAAVSPAIARLNASWVRPKKSARPSSASPPNADDAVTACSVTTPLACPGCGQTTCGILPVGVPSGGFGPYLQAVLTVFAGAYRLSKRQIQQLSADLFGLAISTGMISKLERRSAEVLQAPSNELAVSVHGADAANIDETSWRENRIKAWL